MPATEAEIRLLLERADWRAITLRLRAYARIRVSVLHWRRRCELPKGESADSIANQAIVLILEGARKWDPDVYPDLQGHLESVVDSLVAHLVRSIDHLRWVPLPELESPRDDYPRPPTEDAFPSPEETLLRQEQEREALLELDRAIGEDPDLLQLWLVVQGGTSKAAGIAAALQVPVQEVYRRQRKLLRRLTSQRKARSTGDRHKSARRTARGNKNAKDVQT